MEKDISKKELLVKLFISSFYLSAFTFGGGYVIITLMKKKFADEYHWIDEKEMLDLTAIAQSAPGPIAVNGAIAVGYKLAGLPGMITAVLDTILPPFIIISIVSLFYEAFSKNPYIASALEGMLAGVGAVISSVVYDMAAPMVKSKNILSISVMAAAFILSYFFKVNAAFIVIACGILGAVKTWIAGCRK